ncbi:hypothetical protein LCGC14_1631480 [marine sediment metagenome]|uniref:Uncharacterized protein n=1 Tax=marine sediment metagenome TaxID=412755 RepID=A0A0F9KI33_9ZZZZ
MILNFLAFLDRLGLLSDGLSRKLKRALFDRAIKVIFSGPDEFSTLDPSSDDLEGRLDAMLTDC